MQSFWTSPTSYSFTPFLLSTIMPCDMGCGPSGSFGPAVSPPSSLCTPSLLTGRTAWEAEKFWALCKHCFAINKTFVCYHHYFNPLKIMMPIFFKWYYYYYLKMDRNLNNWLGILLYILFVFFYAHASKTLSLRALCYFFMPELQHFT